MLTDMKEALNKLLKEKLPILAVDLLIDGTRWAKELTDRSAKLLADGTLPAPGFLVDKARAYVKEQEDMYRVLEPDEDWEAKPFEPEPPPKVAKRKSAPKAKKAKTKRAPRKKKAPAKKEEPSS